MIIVDQRECMMEDLLQENQELIDWQTFIRILKKQKHLILELIVLLLKKENEIHEINNIFICKVHTIIYIISNY